MGYLRFAFQLSASKGFDVASTANRLGRALIKRVSQICRHRVTGPVVSLVLGKDLCLDRSKISHAMVISS